MRRHSKYRIDVRPGHGKAAIRSAPKLDAHVTQHLGLRVAPSPPSQF
jgi:hypothetical protein